MTYWHNERVRAARRKSAWNVLLIPAALIPCFLGWWLSARALGHVYHLMHPRASFVVLPETVGGIAIAVGLLFAWCPVAMMTANLLVHAVPPARRGAAIRNGRRALRLAEQRPSGWGRHFRPRYGDSRRLRLTMRIGDGSERNEDVLAPLG